MKLNNDIASIAAASSFEADAFFIGNELSEKVSKTPGMLTANERRFLQNYSRYLYSGQGHIVDLGCWMGSSTLPLAEGVSKQLKNPNSSGKIFAYDLFIWEEWMDDCLKFMPPLNKSYRPGESFRGEFEFYVGEYDNVIVREQDLLNAKWEDGYIELLFVDAMKTPQLALAIEKQFFPKVIEGKGVIVHQDFVHYYTYWIHILTYRLRKFLTPLYDVKDSASTAFQCKKEIPQEIVDSESFEIEALCEDEIEEAFVYSLSLIDSLLSHRVVAAKALLYHRKGEREKATRIINDLMSSGQKNDGEVLAAYRLIADGN